MNSRLTERQKEVLVLIGKGLSNSEIASKLMITLHTVKSHIEVIYNVLKVDCRVPAVITAMKLGIISIDEI